MRVGDFNSDKILLDENLYGHILVYEVSYKTFMGAKALRIRFQNVNGFIKIYDRIRYLVLIGPKRYEAIYDRIRYLISGKSGTTCGISHILQESELVLIIPYLQKKTLIFYNVIILIKSAFNKNKNNYYYNVLLNKGFCEDKSNA